MKGFIAVRVFIGVVMVMVFFRKREAMDEKESHEDSGGIAETRSSFEQGIVKVGVESGKEGLRIPETKVKQSSKAEFFGRDDDASDEEEYGVKIVDRSDDMRILGAALLFRSSNEKQNGRSD